MIDDKLFSDWGVHPNNKKDSWVIYLKEDRNTYIVCDTDYGKTVMVFGTHGVNENHKYIIQFIIDQIKELFSHDISYTLANYVFIENQSTYIVRREIDSIISKLNSMKSFI